MTTINEAVAAVVSGRDLAYDEARDVMDAMMSGSCSNTMMASYLTALAVKGETVDEIAASAAEMRAHGRRLPGDHSDALEIVGTGGDKTGSFNISTTSAFVIAANGVRVAKHGNRSMSSKCGAADVLEALGAKLDISPEASARALDECGFAFMFAQTYHTSMKHVAPVRKELGFRTVFNILGPLTNPASAGSQFSGTYSKDLIEPMALVLSRLGVHDAFVVHGAEGIDEMSVSAETYCCEMRNGNIEKYTVAPEDFGLGRSPLSALVGGGPEENAAITRAVLSGQKGPRRDTVLLNSAAGLFTVGKVRTIQDGIEAAAAAIDSGEAAKRLEAFVRLTTDADRS